MTEKLLKVASYLANKGHYAEAAQIKKVAMYVEPIPDHEGWSAGDNHDDGYEEPTVYHCFASLEEGADIESIIADIEVILLEHGRKNISVRYREGYRGYESGIVFSFKTKIEKKAEDIMEAVEKLPGVEVVTPDQLS